MGSPLTCRASKKVLSTLAFSLVIEHAFDYDVGMSAATIAAFEAQLPWLREDFQADLARLAESTAVAARQYAADAVVIARLAGQVPRRPGESGSTAWTSFIREVALARKCSDRAAGHLVDAAVRLVTCLPRALALLTEGVLTVPRAIAFLSELPPLDDDLAARIDAELADAVALLPPWRIVQEVRKAVLRLDPEAAAVRAAAKNADRGVHLRPDLDDQAVVDLTGPAVPLVRWYTSLDARARALKAAGDPRPLDALRFDLATNGYPCDTHSPADPAGNTDPTAPSGGPATDARDAGDPASAGAEAGLRPSFVEPASFDCRMSRPVQAHILVPVETALGLSNDPAWLEGYGWLSAPTSRQLLLDAELRQACVQAGTGVLVDLASQDVRPPPDPVGLRGSLLAMILGEIELSDTGWRTEPQHDPSQQLRDYVGLRDRSCDGPTGAQVSPSRAELDHDDPYPGGPTAAWNLSVRGKRTHQHKHRGWTPLRTPTGTLWISPAGQTCMIPRHTSPPPGIDTDPSGIPAQLPDPDDLHLLDQLQLTHSDQSPPWLPNSEIDRTPWTWLPGSEDPPF